MYYIHPDLAFTRFRIQSVFKSSGERIQKVVDSYAGYEEKVAD